MVRVLRDFELSVERFDVWRQESRPYTLIDVRNVEERKQFSFDGGINLPLDRLYDMKDNLPRKSDLIVLVCSFGQRSLKACFFLRHQGFNNIYSLSGGVAQWQRYQQERNNECVR